MTTLESTPDETLLLTADYNEAVEFFLTRCKEDREWANNDYTDECIKDFLADGFFDFADGRSLCFLDLTNTPGYSTSTRAVVEIFGGVCQQVWGDRSLGVRVLDWDNLKAGDEFVFSADEPYFHGPDGSYEDFVNKSDSLKEAQELSKENKKWAEGVKAAHNEK